MSEQQENEWERLFHIHDAVAQPLREELAQRSAGEKLYDDYLLAELEKGKKFKIALRKANAKFPTQALNPAPDTLAAVEAHYRFMLDMDEVDRHRRAIEATNQQIAEIDVKIADLLHQISKGSEPSNDPPSG